MVNNFLLRCGCMYLATYGHVSAALTLHTHLVMLRLTQNESTITRKNLQNDSQQKIDNVDGSRDHHVDRNPRLHRARLLAPILNLYHLIFSVNENNIDRKLLNVTMMCTEQASFSTTTKSVCSDDGI